MEPTQMPICCPKCHITWEGEEIPTALMATGNYDTIQDAQKAAEDYGWTPENKLTFGANYIGIEYAYGHPARYDGVSEWNCTACGARFNRWTGERLKPGEFAYRY